MQKVVLASGNEGKRKEFQTIMGDQYLLVPQREFNVSEVPETGTTFVENAIIKARHAAKCTGLPALGDDSGIEVDALQGRPGIYSARYAGEHATAADRNQKLLDEMRDVPDDKRHARFVCVLVFMRHAEDATPIIAQGFCEGMIAHEPRGTHGFGYAPLLYRTQENCTMGELPDELRHQITHRGQAIRALLKLLNPV